jgi:hypothetical protein
MLAEITINAVRIFVLVVFPLVVLTTIVIAVVRLRAYILRQLARDRRSKEVREWARANGFTYSATEALMRFRCQPFECLLKGDHCCSYNVVEGNSGGRPFRAFDHCYHSYYEGPPPDEEHRPLIPWLMGVGKGEHHFSAVVMEAGIPLLPLAIRPRELLDKVTEFIGFEEIGFESAEFSEKFFVRSTDRRWAYDVVHQKTMEVLLAHPGYLMDFNGSQVIAYCHDRMFSLREFESALKLVTGIVEYLPRSAVVYPRVADAGGKTS